MGADLFEPSIRGVIDAKSLKVGRGVVVEEDVVITGKGGPADEVILGDFCFVGRGTRILAPRFRIGDYSKWNANGFGHGEGALQIGRNCWVGGNVVLDSMGGLTIDDNVGIGAHSQLWTHIQFGDVVEGCRFFSRKPMHVGKDAWFVGHCIVSPVRVGERAMAMVGSVIVKDMEANHVYAGVPAKDVTERMGPQFETLDVEEKARRMRAKIEEFVRQRPEFDGRFRVVTSPSEVDDRACCFDVSTRTYNKRYDEAEVAFLKATVPLVKFSPIGEDEFVERASDV
ncbi:MAG: acyltransferase [Deltaproteobacteria bacterium]|nr:acyltransferase [Deltaproteobacteria bacterium]